MKAEILYLIVIFITSCNEYFFRDMILKQMVGFNGISLSNRASTCTKLYFSKCHINEKDIEMNEGNDNCFLISWDKVSLTDWSGANERCHCRNLGEPNTINNSSAFQNRVSTLTLTAAFIRSSLTDTVLSLDVFRKGLLFASCAKVSRNVYTITERQTKSRNKNRE